MKKLLLSLPLLALGLQVQAQQEIYALTGLQSPNIIFKDFRALDMRNGQTSAVIFSSDSTPNVISDTRKVKVDEVKNSYNNAQASAIATLALDGNNLVYTPMYSTNFYALDLKTKQITLIENSVAKSMACDINSHFTRMATGTDGAIYTLNNSGSQLLKISNINGKYEVKDLGEVSNDVSNGDHNFKIMTVGYGGDMVADTDNNFYIFAASGNVFKLNTNDRVLKYWGKVTGLPENYSLNGAAVNENGEVVVGSAKGGDLYEVNINNLTAHAIYGGVQHQIYDLASKHFIGENKGEVSLVQNDIYPTKVTDGNINIQLEPSLTKSLIKVEVFNTVGTKVVEKTLNTGRRMSLLGLPQGVYIVNVLGEKGETLIAKKVLLAR